MSTGIAGAVGAILAPLIPHVEAAIREGLTGERALASAVERMLATSPGDPIGDRLREAVDRHATRVRERRQRLAPDGEPSTLVSPAWPLPPPPPDPPEREE